uniref:Uncharacterized protein n=1 Tax=Panagrolaimus sp. PS1159 TaxID=55785 RepID=A0AC35EZF8_9BILA
MHISNNDATLVLVAHGEDPDTSLNKVIIPHIEKGGPLPPLPCVVAGSGTHEHGQTFLKNNFHYKCNNGTAEVIACVSEDMSVIQINRTFLRNGIRHKCLISGETVTYEQQNGPVIEGCYIQNRESDIVLLGESMIIGRQKHSCEVMPYGKIRYTVNALGCKKGEEIYSEGQIWTDKHIRYQCVESGVTRVLGCIDDGGLFIELGRDLLMQGVVHRCYKVNNTTFYHRFQCAERSLHDCLVNAPTPRRVRNVYNRKA